MIRTINDITIEDVSAAAQEISDKYIYIYNIDRAIVKGIFIEGVLWAQKVQRDKRVALELENTEFDYGHNVNYKTEEE